eukprot:15482182-Alexandrium_andersonii.AAC.1
MCIRDSCWPARSLSHLGPRPPRGGAHPRAAAAAEVEQEAEEAEVAVLPRASRAPSSKVSRSGAITRRVALKAVSRLSRNPRWEVLKSFLRKRAACESPWKRRSALRERRRRGRPC